jgi:hypothetical protein
MRTMIRKILLSVAVSAVVLLAACGGGSSSNGGSQAQSPNYNVWVVPDATTDLADAARAAFAGGTLYYNAHTNANPGGEVRGQLDNAGAVRLATLTGAQETPAVTTTALGAGLLQVEPGGRVRGWVVTSGVVNPTVAHVHLGPRGTAGGIIVPLAGGPDVWVVADAQPPLTAEQVAAFNAGQLYFNVHTQANPNGEIRGQLDKTGAVRATALDGAQETPAVATSGRGGGVLSVDPTTGAAAGFVVNTGLFDATVAHVHSAARGTAGPIRVPLSGGPTLWVVPDDATPLAQADRDAFLAGNLYFNVHTAANPNGEIRGQLDRGGTARLASLDGAQERPNPVTTSAFGGGVLVVNDAAGATGGDVTGFLVTPGLQSPTVAHVHTADRNTAGPILVPLSGP